jgi:hypothetical protein
MIRRIIAGAALAFALVGAAACGLVSSTNRSVFFVFDVSGTYVKAVPDATKLANLTIAKLLPGDWVGASQISACSFSEKEMILQRQLPNTPSLAAATKRDLFNEFNSCRPGEIREIHRHTRRARPGRVRVEAASGKRPLHRRLFRHARRLRQDM